jgi:transaldolase
VARTISLRKLEPILVKLASTWEGIDTNLTLLFSKTQAIACADAGVFLISPFVGWITDWYKKYTGTSDYPPAEDPGVTSVCGICNYYKANDVPTVVMGASFRSTGHIAGVAGCDRLTISPNFLEEFDASDAPLERVLSPDSFEPESAVEMDEARFRWEMNADAMATEMLAAGIRGFAKDLGKLRDILRQKLA